MLERMGVEGGRKTFHKLVRFPTKFNDYVLPRALSETPRLGLMDFPWLSGAIPPVVVSV